METIAVIAVYESGGWRYERLMINDQGDYISVEISQAEYDQVLGSGGVPECENCP